MHLVVAGLKEVVPDPGVISIRQVYDVDAEVGGTVFRPRGTPLALVVVAIL
jgi:hypothetical protein